MTNARWWEMSGTGRFALLTAAAGAVFGAPAAEQYVTSGRDLAALEVTGDPVFHQTGATPPNPALVFTLSADRELPKANCQVYPHNGREIRFDFSDGGHTLSFASGTAFYIYPGWGTYAYPAATNRVVLKGGTWDFANRTTVNFIGRWGYSMKQKGNEIVLDGAVVTNAAILYAMNGPIDTRVRLTNGSRLYNDATTSSGGSGSAYVFFAWGNSDNRILSTNCAFSVESGSRFVSACSTLAVDQYYWNGGGSGETRNLDNIGNFRFLVTGAGSLLDAKTAHVGAVGGTELRFADGACGNLTGIHLGIESHAKEAGLLITGGAIVTNASSFYQGYVAGADRTRVSVLDGGLLVLRNASGSRFHHYVGYQSAFNEMTVSNATLECLGLYLGNVTYPNATNNTLRLLGENLNPDFVSDGWVPFETANNRVIVGDRAAVTIRNSSGALVDFFHARTAAGNELIVEDGAELKARYFWIGEDTAASVPEGQKVIVRNGGLLHATTQISNAGDGSTFVVSNGTLQADNQYAMYFGYSSANVGHTVRNNRVILQGDRPQLRSANDAAIFSFQNGSVLRFDVPALADYKVTPVMCAQLYFSDTSTVEIGNLTAARKNLRTSKKVRLAQATASLDLSVAKIKAINDRLEAEEGRGCYLYRATDGQADAAGKEIWLRVACAPKGFTILFK